MATKILRAVSIALHPVHSLASLSPKPHSMIWKYVHGGKHLPGYKSREAEECRCLLWSIEEQTDKYHRCNAAVRLHPATPRKQLGCPTPEILESRTIL